MGCLVLFIIIISIIAWVVTFIKEHFFLIIAILVPLIVLCLLIRHSKVKKFKQEELKRLEEEAELRRIQEEENRKLQEEENRRLQEILEIETFLLVQLGLSCWPSYENDDFTITVKSRNALEKYDELSFFKEDSSRLDLVDKILKDRAEIGKKLKKLLENKEFQNNEYFSYFANRINGTLFGILFYKIRINYISQAGNLLDSNLISVDENTIRKYKENPCLLMTKGEYNKYLKEQEKEKLNEKHQYFYSHVNYLVDYVNENKQFLILKGSEEKVDELMLKLFDRTVNGIKKIKTVDSEEWDLIYNFIMQIRTEISEIMDKIF